MNYFLLLAGVLTGLITAYLFTALVAKKAIRFHIVDKPRTDRFHQRTTALMGGVAINLALLFTLVVLAEIPVLWGLTYGILLTPVGIFLFRKNISGFIIASIVAIVGATLLTYSLPIDEFTVRFLWFIIGSQIIFLVGAFDDAIKPVYASSKFIFQLIAAGILAYHTNAFPFFPAPISFIITMFWVVGIINALNLIDNMNGLSSGVAALSALFFAIYNFSYGYDSLGIVSLILMGALLGFLPHNFPNARIFMGDSGSLLLGFLLAGISLMGNWESQASFDMVLFLPVCILGYPIFDVTFVTINRIREGRPVYIGGKDHSSHLLVQLGLKPSFAVLLIYGLTMIVGLLALLMEGLNFPYTFTIFAAILLVLIGFGLAIKRMVLQSTRKAAQVKNMKTPDEESNKGIRSATGTY